MDKPHVLSMYERIRRGGKINIGELKELVTFLRRDAQANSGFEFNQRDDWRKVDIWYYDFSGTMSTPTILKVRNSTITYVYPYLKSIDSVVAQRFKAACRRAESEYKRSRGGNES